MSPVATHGHVTANDAFGKVHFYYSNRSAPNPELRHFERSAADRVKCSALLQAASCPDIFFEAQVQSLAAVYIGGAETWQPPAVTIA